MKMQLSIAEIMNIPAFYPVSAAFADVLGEDYRDPGFEPDQAVADAVAEYIDTKYQIAAIGTETLFGVQTKEAFDQQSVDAYKRYHAAVDVFRLLRLQKPAAWIEDV